MKFRFLKCLAALFLITGSLAAQVTTYMNPIQPGDHPDQTLMRVGNDFYTTGSNFHFSPYVPIYHSTDLVNWEIISRVVPSSQPGTNDKPSGGIWQGALAEFGGKFWVYYSINAQQHFSYATSMKGPWSAPTRVTASTVTGYDNSVFVDDDGTPYMHMKNAQYINRIQEIDKKTGQLTGSLMNLDWINAQKQYSWAEGPVMCKRNGRYYMFVAGDVSGGQYTLSSAKLSANEADWTRHGNFWGGANKAPFTGPNHITQPIELDDGTWWCLSHSYDNSGWAGQGRLGLLHQVLWDASGVPHGVPASTTPVTAPVLSNSNSIAMNLPRDDYFSSNTIDLDWHFFSVKYATKYSLSANPGYMRLIPGSGTTHILQKEGGHFYTMVTKVTVNATASNQQAGLRITNGSDALNATLYVGNSGSGKIGFAYNGSTTEVNNSVGNTVWLKIDRQDHYITGYYSADGYAWTKIGSSINVSELDKYQGTDWNSWVGTSIGLYATNVNADFDLFKYRDGFSALKAQGYNNFNGVATSAKAPGTVVSNTTNGGWFMLAGVNMGTSGEPAGKVIVNAASASGSGSLEVWIDNIGGNGTKLATIPVSASGGADSWKDYTANVNVSGQHDLYCKFVGSAGVFNVNTIRFEANTGAPTVKLTTPTVSAMPDDIVLSANFSDPDEGDSVVHIAYYNGDKLIVDKWLFPFVYNWTGVTEGTYTISAVAYDLNGNSSTDEMTLTVVPAQEAYKPNTIPGTIQFENYDIGGNGFAYYDDSEGSETSVDFRTTEDVDIEVCTDADGGYNIGYATAGEWVEYTATVETTGVYDIALRVACNGDGRMISLSSDGVDFSKDVPIPNTGGWQAWEYVQVDGVSLEAGTHVLRVTVGAESYVNLNYMTFTLASTSVKGDLKYEMNGLAVYPNPLQDNGIIKVPQVEDAKIIIYASNGEVKATLIPEKGEKTISWKKTGITESDVYTVVLLSAKSEYARIQVYVVDKD